MIGKEVVEDHGERRGDEEKEFRDGMETKEKWI